LDDKLFQGSGVTAVKLPDARRVADSIVLGQVYLTAAIAVLCYLLAGAHAGLSAAIGGGIGAAANFVLARVAFRRGAQDSGRAVRAFFIGEAAKFGVVVVLFVLVLTTLKSVVVPAALLGSYVASFVVYWVVLARARLSEGGEEPPQPGVSGS
jgi:ATP synthase protein I